MLYEDAPTNSVGTGQETSLPPSSEPGVRLRKKKLSRVKSMLDIKLESKLQQFPFLVEVPGIGNFIMSGSSPMEVKFNLRKIIQPTVTDTKVKITRLNQGEAIKYYMNRTNKSMKGIYEETMEIQEAMPMQQTQPVAAEKQDQAKQSQTAKQDAQKRIQLAKQNMQKQLQQKKIEMQKNLANQQKILQQKAKTGSLNSPSA